MTKALLIILLAVFSSTAFANLKQGNWRWRTDNGNETSASWLQQENASIAMTSRSVFRLRTELFTTVSGTYHFCLQYSTSLNPQTWIDVTNTAGTRAFELAGWSSFITDNTNTTPQLGGSSEAASYAFQPGAVYLTTEMVSRTISSNARSEFEWAIMPTNNIQAGITYTFRIANATSVTPLATVNTGSTLPIDLVAFSAKAEAKRVKLDWTTASELNNDRFELERSSDGNNFRTIQTIKAAGTSNTISNYSVYDNSPLNATNYYRLRQIDLDGKTKVSQVVVVKFRKAQLSTVAVYPNPTFSDIRFALDNVTAKNITATLVSLTGKVIHTETMSAGNSANYYRLNLAQKPAPGTYIIQVNAPDLALTGKVVVQ